MSIGSTTWDGVKFEVKGSDFKELLEKRAKYYEKRAEFHRRKREAVLKAAGDVQKEMQDEEDDPIAAQQFAYSNKVSGGQYDTARAYLETARSYDQQAKHFKFLADHVKSLEIYQLAKHEVALLELDQ